jgi:hypothetical protein
MELTDPLPAQNSESEALEIGLTEYSEFYTSTLFRGKVSSFVKDESDVTLF